MSSLRCSFDAVTLYEFESLWRTNFRKAREIKDYLGFKGCSFIVFNEDPSEPGRIIVSYDPNGKYEFEVPSTAVKHLANAFPEITITNFKVFNRFDTEERNE
jgi:hypothetical protein